MTNQAGPLDQAILVTERICGEVRNAQLVWAHFEAINGETDADRCRLRDGVNGLGLGNTLRSILLAVARDTLSALFRVTDDPGKDRLTLCRLSALLAKTQLWEDRKRAAKSWLGLDSDVEHCCRCMQAIIDAVPPKWTDTPPADPRLYELRTRLRPLRDTSLAHALEGDGNVVINDIREFLELASELAQCAELVFQEASADWKGGMRLRFKEANEFWDHCERGF